MANQRAGILGTGHAYPEGILTNADLAELVETSDEWITTRTGIKQRRKASPGEYTSMFAVRAAQKAIERARIDPSEIDLLLCATVTPDQILPSTGCIIQAELGAHNAAAMDVVAACSGFLYGVALANSMIQNGQSKYALVIGSEILTQYVDYTDRQTCVLYCLRQSKIIGKSAAPLFSHIYPIEYVPANRHRAAPGEVAGVRTQRGDDGGIPDRAEERWNGTGACRIPAIAGRYRDGFIFQRWDQTGNPVLGEPRIGIAKDEDFRIRSRVLDGVDQIVHFLAAVIRNAGDTHGRELQ